MASERCVPTRSRRWRSTAANAWGAVAESSNTPTSLSSRVRAMLARASCSEASGRPSNDGAAPASQIDDPVAADRLEGGALPRGGVVRFVGAGQCRGGVDGLELSGFGSEDRSARSKAISWRSSSVVAPAISSSCRLDDVRRAMSFRSRSRAGAAVPPRRGWRYRWRRPRRDRPLRRVATVSGEKCRRFSSSRSATPITRPLATAAR